MLAQEVFQRDYLTGNKKGSDEYFRSMSSKRTYQKSSESL